MNKITPKSGPAGHVPAAPADQPGKSGSASFRSTVEKSRHAATLQPREGRAPLPVDREQQRKRRKPPVYETLETVALKDALEIQGKRGGKPIARRKGIEYGDPAIAVVAADGSGETGAAPVLAYSTIFMDGRQFTRWKTGKSDPVVDRNIHEMLSEIVEESDDQ